jgi:hypothetical protein
MLFLSHGTPCADVRRRDLVFETTVEGCDGQVRRGASSGRKHRNDQTSEQEEASLRVGCSRTRSRPRSCMPVESEGGSEARMNNAEVEFQVVVMLHPSTPPDVLHGNLGHAMVGMCAG